MRNKILFLFSLSAYLTCFGAQAQKRGVYTNIEHAINEPDKVRVLDIRGQGLNVLPAGIISFYNVEAILLSDKRRNLWLYPRAWKYKFHFKQLPGGGYRHLQGRGKGHFYSSNNLTTLPIDFCQFPNLRVLDMENTHLPYTLRDSVADNLRRCNPQIIILGGGRFDNNNPAAQFSESMKRQEAAEEYLHSFKIKH